MGVGLVAVLAHKLAIDTDVELPMASGYELEGVYVLTSTIQSLSRHPGGSRGVSSVVAVENLDIQLAVLRHGAPPWSMKGEQVNHIPGPRGCQSPM